MFTTTLKYLNLFILPNPTFEIPPSEEDPIYHIHPRKSDQETSFISPIPVPVPALPFLSASLRGRSRRHTQSYTYTYTRVAAQQASVTRKPASRKAEERARRRNTICGGGAPDSPSYVAISYESLSESENTDAPTLKRTTLETVPGAGNACTSDDSDANASTRRDASVAADIDHRVKVQIQTPAPDDSPIPAGAQRQLTNDIAAPYAGDYSLQNAKDKGKGPASPYRKFKDERRVSAPPAFNNGGASSSRGDDAGPNGNKGGSSYNIAHHVISPASAMYALPHSQLIVLPPPTTVKTNLNFLGANPIVKPGTLTPGRQEQYEQQYHHQHQASMSQSLFGSNMNSIPMPAMSMPIPQRSQHNASPSKMFELDLSPIPESDSGAFSEPSAPSEPKSREYENRKEGDNKVHGNVQGQSTSTLSGESSGSSTSYGELLEDRGTDYYSSLSYYGTHSGLVRGERMDSECNFHLKSTPHVHEHQHQHAAHVRYSTRNNGEFGELELEDIHVHDERCTDDDSLVIPKLVLTIPTPDLLDCDSGVEQGHHSGHRDSRGLEDGRVGGVAYEDHNTAHEHWRKQEKRRSVLAGIMAESVDLGRAALDRIVSKTPKDHKLPRTHGKKQTLRPEQEHGQDWHSSHSVVIDEAQPLELGGASAIDGPESRHRVDIRDGGRGASSAFGFRWVGLQLGHMAVGGSGASGRRWPSLIKSNSSSNNSKNANTENNTGLARAFRRRPYEDGLERHNSKRAQSELESEARDRADERAALQKGGGKRWSGFASGDGGPGRGRGAVVEEEDQHAASRLFGFGMSLSNANATANAGGLGGRMDAMKNRERVGVSTDMNVSPGAWANGGGSRGRWTRDHVDEEARLGRRQEVEGQIDESEGRRPRRHSFGFGFLHLQAIRRCGVKRFLPRQDRKEGA